MLLLIDLILGVDQGIIQNTNTNLSKYLLKTLFMRHMNMAGALVSLKVATVNS